MVEGELGLRLIFSPGRLRNERRRSDAEHLRQRQHYHGEIAGNTNCSDRFLAEMSHPIEVSQQVERLHEHADGKEGRHLQQVFADGTLGEIFHVRGEFWLCYNAFMSVQVYGCNHIAIEVDDVEAAVRFYQDVFNLEKMDGGEGDAFLKLGEHQFLAIFEVERVKPDRVRHFGLIVRDEKQLTEVRKKVEGKYGLKLEPRFRCDFRDPGATVSRWSICTMNRWSGFCLMRVQKVGIKF